MFSENAFSDPFGFGIPYTSAGRNPNPFSSAYSNRRRQEEQLARSRKIMMEQERRRRAEYETRRRKEHEHEMKIARSRREEQLRRDMLLQRERSKMEQMRRSQQRLGKKQPSQKRAASYPPGTVVRGPDGNLYRVAAPPRRERENDMALRYSGANFDGNFNVASDDDKENDEEEVLSTNECESVKHGGLSDDESGSSQEWHDYQDNCEDGTQVGNHMLETTGQALPPKKQVPLHEIIVETVPNDEDDELREMKSVWRNRIPSPGKWIEPVESFGSK